ncbi:plasmid mobilization relaxosome protein MobC [Clavibacter michiganensis]|uniref:plasmid mobilization relaxosome protein MobC n=1 Tax=Clavibacter michiganensis TaxID=28447 RepID=UPI0015E254B9|nr:plasmid mobilization relaxosome protein MobC [Clavibacter michiganensis]
MGDEPSDARVQRQRRAPGGRHHRHVVRATDEEEVRLLALAAPRGIGVVKLLMDSALNGGADAAAEKAAVREEVMPALFQTRRLLAGVANNVNQLAKASNATGVVPPEAAATLEAVRRTTSNIDTLLVEIGSAVR